MQQLLDRYPAGDTPAVDLDDLDLLDPWVIDGRYAADLPGLTPGDARRLMTAAERMVDDCLRTGPNSTSERNKRERSQRSRTAVNTKHRLGSRWEAICSVAEKL